MFQKYKKLPKYARWALNTVGATFIFSFFMMGKYDTGWMQENVIEKCLKGNCSSKQIKDLKLGMKIYCMKNKKNCSKLSKAFMSKARQAEAKVALFSLHSVEKASFAELGTYQTRMIREMANVNIGRYVIGFPQDCAKKYFPNQHTALTPEGVYHPNKRMPSSAVYSKRAVQYLNQFAKWCQHPKRGFYAFAIGDIDGDAGLDVWVIDQNKNIRNVVSDLDTEVL